MKRSEQRRHAVVALYQHDVTGRPLHELFERDARPFTKALAHAVEDHQEELDALISQHAQGWSLERIAPLERNILRVGVFELLHPDTASEDAVPPEVAIDEAVEIAKTYCGADAPGFVNGVLAAVMRENPTPS